MSTKKLLVNKNGVAFVPEFVLDLSYKPATFADKKNALRKKYGADLVAVMRKTAEERRVSWVEALNLLYEELKPCKR